MKYIVSLIFFCFSTLFAEEGAFPLYLLGFMGPKAGYMPPPGLYLRNDLYHHPGHVKGTVLGGVVEAKANVKLSFDLLTMMYVSKYKLLGADVGCLALLPIGRVDVHAQANLSVPTILTRSRLPTVTQKSFSVSKHQVAHGVGDTLIAPLMLGWHVDNLHLLFYQGLFIPTGKYTKGKVANMGQNHFATETDAGFTWLNPDWGTEVSAITGITCNFTNHKIHYKSGTGWHTEWFLGQYLTKEIELGFAGYWFHQLTPDSGTGSKALGGFRGKAIGLGPCLSCDFTLFGLPINANARYYKEMNTKNYLKGDSFYFTLNIPL